MDTALMVRWRDEQADFRGDRDVLDVLDNQVNGSQTVSQQQEEILCMNCGRKSTTPTSGVDLRSQGNSGHSSATDEPLAENTKRCSRQGLNSYARDVLRSVATIFRVS